MMRAWLMALIREAVREELEQHFRSLENKLESIEAILTTAAQKVVEKQERKAIPAFGLQWGAIARKREQETE
jgi:hypothetical protein